jgi:hypothetical protein
VPGAAARADTLGASTSIPLKLEMGPVTPNPSDGTVRFRLDLPAPGFVRVTILDVAGRLIHETAEQRPAGRHTLAWSSRSSSGTSRAGVYFLRVQVDGRTIATRRTVVVP